MIRWLLRNIFMVGPIHLKNLGFFGLFVWRGWGRMVAYERNLSSGRQKWERIGNFAVSLDYSFWTLRGLYGHFTQHILNLCRFLGNTRMHFCYLIFAGQEDIIRSLQWTFATHFCFCVYFFSWKLLLWNYSHILYLRVNKHNLQVNSIYVVSTMQ